MRTPRVNDFIRLVQDIPELGRHQGEIGVVRDISLAPTLAFEVEFYQAVAGHQRQALLTEEQIQVQEGPLLTDEVADLWRGNEYVSPQPTGR